MRPTRRAEALRILATVAAAGAACAPAAAAGTPLRVGTLPIDPCGQALYAHDDGFFAAADLQVELSIMTSAAAIVAAVAAGALDVGFASIPGLALAHQHGIPVRFFAPAAIYRGGPGNTIMMVAKSSPDRSGADLTGKTVAVSALRDLTQFESAHWIDATGGDSKSVSFVELHYPEMAPAMQQGRVQAACMIEPFVTAAKNEARQLANLSAQIGGPYLVGGWFANTDWIAKNVATVQRCADALQKAAVWANAHPAASATILLPYAKISPQLVASMTRARYDESARIDPATVQRALDLMVKYGALQPISANELIYQGAA